MGPLARPLSVNMDMFEIGTSADESVGRLALC